MLKHPFVKIVHRMILIACGVIVSLSIANAESPLFWTFSTQNDFLKGEFDNVSIGTDGRLALSPRSDRIFETNNLFIWSSVVHDENLWIGTGSDGHVFKIDSDGRNELIFDAIEENVHAIHPIDSSDALVGSSPNGAVFQISRSDNNLIFDPSDTYIWDLEIDDEGNYFVATGDDGRIYRITPNGDTNIFYEGTARHILSLVIDTNGDLLAGTGDPGQIIRINENGESFVLFDSSFQEIRSLHVGEANTIYAAALSASSSTRATSTIVSPSTTNSSGTISAPSGVASSSGTGTSTSHDNTSNLKGAVYRVHYDGRWDRVWESSHETPYDINYETPGNLLISTGPDGRLLQVTQDPPRTTLLLRAPAEQITSLATTESKTVFYTTASPAGVYKLGRELADSGTYTSPVMDAGSHATWGAVRWAQSQQPARVVQFFTRSGNTENPIKNWSPWSRLAIVNGPQINSPKARYLQWKVELQNRDVSPDIFSVSLSYLPQNLRPQITKLTLHEPGIVFQSSFPSNDPPVAGLDRPSFSQTSASSNNGITRQSTPNLGRRIYRKGLQTIEWTAHDRNNDILSYDLFYKKDVESTWLPLRRTLETTLYTWDTSSTPDGAYLVRLIATDRPSNTEESSLSDLQESARFLIDNTQPTIQFLESTIVDGAVNISFLVRDEQSPIQHVEYSIDALNWTTLYAEDGIADSEVENFQVTVDGSVSGSIVIRAKDSMGNIITRAVPM